MKRFLCLVLSVVVLSTSVFIVPASAVSYSGAATLESWYDTWAPTEAQTGTQEIEIPYTGYFSVTDVWRVVGFRSFTVNAEITSPYGIYVSYYIDSSGTGPSAWTT